MPITKSAKKALRVSLEKKAINDRVTKNLKEKMKLAERGSGDKAKLMSDAYSAIDKASKSGIIKKNTASRRKARISKALKAK